MNIFANDVEINNQINLVYECKQKHMGEQAISEELRESGHLNIKTGSPWTVDEVIQLIEKFNLWSDTPRFLTGNSSLPQQDEQTTSKNIASSPEATSNDFLDGPSHIATSCGQCGSEVLTKFCGSCGAHYRRGPFEYFFISGVIGFIGVEKMLDGYWLGILILALSGLIFRQSIPKEWRQPWW